MPRPNTTLVLAIIASLGLVACGDEQSIRVTNPDSVARQKDSDTEGHLTLAVIGDTPYGPVKLSEFPQLVDKINNDNSINLVVHLGDIKAGKNSACTDEYFSMIRGLFDTFNPPLVYTPGDNEWTDCHVATKNNGLYTPTERLQAVRTLFFPVAGQTLGKSSKHVTTEASDPMNSAYVENVLWTQSNVVFATLNITGSNNDLISWGSPLPADAGSYPSQADESVARAQANHAWVARAFETAMQRNAAAVVLAFQADMWDPAEPNLSGFDDLVQQIGTLAAQFGKPVLLLEGDSHSFRVDNPYTVGDPLHTRHANTPIADNVTRIVVEGSDAGRTEYLRLTVNPSMKSNPFSWTRVPLF